MLVHEEREAKGDLALTMALVEDKARRWRRTWGRSVNRWAWSVSSTGCWRGAHALRGVGRVGQIKSAMAVAVAVDRPSFHGVKFFSNQENYPDLKNIKSILVELHKFPYFVGWNINLKGTTFLLGRSPNSNWILK
jgi:hypothetical protein